MNNEQAIDIINTVLEDDLMLSKKDYDAMKIAIKALQENDKLKDELAELKEKQVAKKPIRMQLKETEWMCQNCGVKWYHNRSENYCCYCGQKLK